MNSESHQYVYHGSHEKFEQAIPRPNKRMGKDGRIMFDQISFHATPHRDIALFYTYTERGEIIIDERRIYPTCGVSLYKWDKTVEIEGVGTLEENLKAMYGNGGYIHVFNAKDFHYTIGLGPLEVISSIPVSPVRIEYIADPVQEMKDAGVTFVFRDLSLPENEHFRNYLS